MQTYSVPLQPVTHPSSTTPSTARRSGPRRPRGSSAAESQQRMKNQLHQGVSEYAKPWAIVYVATLAVLSIPTVVLPAVTAIVAAVVVLAG